MIIWKYAYRIQRKVSNEIGWRVAIYSMVATDGLVPWFSNRVSTATVVGNGYLQVVTCKYLIICSLDKYKLLVPHQVCAFAQKRLIELKSTLVGGGRGLINFRPRSAELPLLLSHGCPIIGRAAPMHFYTNCSDWAQIWWDNPRWDCPCLSRRSRQSWPKRTSMLIPISPKKGIFFNGKRKFSKSRKRGSFYF